MDEEKPQPIPPFRDKKRSPGGRKGPTALLAGAILCICLALIYQFGLAGVSPLPDAGAESVTSCETDLAGQLETLNVPGLAVAIVKDGELACISVAGLANDKNKIPVTPSTLFLVASISKTITATALMQLHEKGEFELDDDINDYLPFDVKIPAYPKSPITFRQLLTHSASIKDNRQFFDDFATDGKDSPISLAELTEEYLTPDGEYYSRNGNFLASSPGSKLHYSNMGIALAGYLVEVISGQPFDKYCRANIFTPLSMHKSSWRLAEVDLPNLATPYASTYFGPEPIPHYGQANYPDGMLRTSPIELARFLTAYMRGGIFNYNRVLKTSTIETMLSYQTAFNQSQGLVWFSRWLDGRNLWGHDGSDDGASADMWFDPEDETGVIMMANGTWEDEDQLLEQLFQEADTY